MPELITRILDIVTLRRLKQALQELWTKKIVPLVQSSIVPEQKEVLSVTLVADIEDVTTPESDAYYLVPPLDGSTNPDAENGQLYQYTGGTMSPISGDKGIIYVGTENDTPRMFVFNGTKYVLCQNGEVVDNTIVISSLDELDGVTDQGIYNVTFVHNTRPVTQDYYTLSVGLSGILSRDRKTIQTLSNASGYKSRYKSIRMITWTAWTEFIYASTADIEREKALLVSKSDMDKKEYSISKALNKNRTDIDKNAIKISDHEDRLASLEENQQDVESNFSIHLRKEKDNLMVVIENGGGEKYHTIKKMYEDFTPEEKEQFAHGEKMDGYAYLISVYKRKARRWVTPAFGKEWNKQYCKFDAYKNYTKFFVNNICAYPFYEYRTIADDGRGEAVREIILDPNQRTYFGFPTISKCSYWRDLLHYAGHGHLTARKYHFEDDYRDDDCSWGNSLNRTLKCRVALYHVDNGCYTRVSNYAHYFYYVSSMAECNQIIEKRLQCIIDK